MIKRIKWIKIKNKLVQVNVKGPPHPECLLVVAWV